MTAIAQRIAVLGAGPMGLAVAYQLTIDGYRPVIFEADDRVGGMTATFDFEGLEIERYYHFHCTSDRDFLQILEELQISDKMHWVETKMAFWYQNRLQAWGNPMALLKFRGLGLLAKIRYGLHAFMSTKRTDWQPLDAMEASGWVKRWVGEEAFEVLWRKLFDLKFYEYSRSLSAAWIWSRIRRLGTSRYSIFREKLGHLEGGSRTLLEKLEHTIEEKGGSFRLRTPVQKVVIEAGQVRGIETADGFEEFDKVISTIPLPYVPRIMPDLPDDILNRYQSLKNIAVVCVIAKLRKPVSDYFWVNTNDSEMDIPGLVEYTNLQPLDQHVVYVPFYLPGDHPKYRDPDDKFIHKVQQYLTKINPDLGAGDFISIRASRYRFAQPVCQPGHLKKLPPVNLPVEGLWVADTSYYYPEDRGISESIGFGRDMAREATA